MVLVSVPFSSLDSVLQQWTYVHLSVIEFEIDFKLNETLTTWDQYASEGFPPIAILYGLNLMEAFWFVACQERVCWLQSFVFV